MLSILILWVVATVNFLIWRDNPLAFAHELEEYTDPVTRSLLLRGANELLPLRYAHYLHKMFTYGLVYPYFGWSVIANGYVAEEISRRLPITLFLMGASLIGSIVIGISIGTFAASRQGTKKDKLITASSLFTWSMPVFIIQFLAIFIFSYLLVKYNIYIFPLNAALPVPRPTGLTLCVAIAWHMTLPIITLILTGIGPWVMQTRNIIIDTLTQDYITTARAKGLSERAVVYKHAFKTILPQVSTMIALAIPAVITGSIITETIFAVNGIGNYFCRCWIVEGVGGTTMIRILDPQAIQAVFFIYATIAVILNLIADLTYGVFDPRIRIGAKK